MVSNPSIHLRGNIGCGWCSVGEAAEFFSVIWRQTVSPVIIRVPQYLNFWASRHKYICQTQHSWATWLDADTSVNRLARLQGDGGKRRDSWLVDVYQALAVTYRFYTDNSRFQFTIIQPLDFAVVAKVGNDFCGDAEDSHCSICVILKPDRNMSRKNI